VPACGHPREIAVDAVPEERRPAAPLVLADALSDLQLPGGRRCRPGPLPRRSTYTAPTPTTTAPTPWKALTPRSASPAPRTGDATPRPRRGHCSARVSRVFRRPVASAGKLPFNASCHRHPARTRLGSSTPRSGVRRGRLRTRAQHLVSTCPSPPASPAVPARAPRH